MVSASQTQKTKALVTIANLRKKLEISIYAENFLVFLLVVVAFTKIYRM